MILALLRYGSTLSPLTARPDSVPDLFALVDDRAATLRDLGHAHLARLPLYPPVTIAHGGGKLSLITPEEAAARDDLYVAGRLSKKIEVLHGDVGALVDAAITTVVEVSALDLPRRISVDDAVLRCLGISYRGEVRPEGPDKVRRLFEAFPDFYLDRFAPRIEAHARARGVAVHNGRLISEPSGARRGAAASPWRAACLLIDGRNPRARAREQRQLRRILGRSRRRSMLRWPQQLLIFDGSLRYVLGKLRRSWI